IVDDAISLPRGLAMKVMDVAGERLPDAEGTTQDFVMVNAPTFQMKNAERFLANLKMLAATTDRAEGAKVALSNVLRPLQAALDTVGLASPKIGAMGGTPNTDPLGETYYSATPFRYGEYVAKFGLFPVSQDLLARRGEKIDASEDENAIRHTIREEMRAIEGHWEFRVQLCRDLDKHPIEDPMTEWDEAASPFVTVARLTVAPQDSWDEERVRLVNEQLRFSIWTGLAAHRPLGNINRARNAPYAHSARYRERYNGCPIHEPG
ncbi:MAG: catalase family protein, partial [Erythrobacter sp.]|nr:catalase family protein [Erythrobacter sp.]